MKKPKNEVWNNVKSFTFWTWLVLIAFYILVYKIGSKVIDIIFLLLFISIPLFTYVINKIRFKKTINKNLDSKNIITSNRGKNYKYCSNNKYLNYKQYNDPIENKYIKSDKFIQASEERYLKLFDKYLSEEYRIVPQVNLASIIDKTTNEKYYNDLFRNIDFGIFDKDTYNIKLLIEINDKSHYRNDRQERDRKVKEICKSAHIPLITFWTDENYSDMIIVERVKYYLA